MQKSISLKPYKRLTDISTIKSAIIRPTPILIKNKSMSVSAKQYITTNGTTRERQKMTSQMIDLSHIVAITNMASRKKNATAARKTLPRVLKMEIIIEQKIVEKPPPSP